MTALVRNFFSAVSFVCLLATASAGPELSVQFNVFDENSQSDPQVSVLENGNFVVVYESQNQVAADSGDDIFAIIADENGQKVVEEFVVNSETLGDQDSPDVTGLSDGNFAVVWGSFDQLNGIDILLQVFSPEGNQLLGADVIVNDNTSNVDQELPKVAALDNDKFVVVWQDGANINGQIFNNDGGQFGGRLLLASNRNAGVVAGIPNSNGNFAVAFEDGDTVEGSVFGNLGQSISLFTVSNEVVSSQPSISPLGDGFVVSFTKTLNGDSDVFAQRFDENGVAVGDQFLVNTGVNGQQQDSDVLETVDGFVVVWESIDATTDVFLQRFDANGARIDDETKLNQGDEGNDAAVAGLLNGKVVIAWEKETGDAVLLDDIQVGILAVDEEDDDEDDNNAGLVAGVSIAAVAGVLLVAAIVRRSRNRNEKAEFDRPAPSGDYASPFARNAGNPIPHYPPPPMDRSYQGSMLPPSTGTFGSGASAMGGGSNVMRPPNNGFRAPTLGAPPQGNGYGQNNYGQQSGNSGGFLHMPRMSMGNRTLPSAKWFSAIYKRAEDAGR